MSKFRRQRRISLRLFLYLMVRVALRVPEGGNKNLLAM